jgi:hypothetical protein
MFNRRSFLRSVIGVVTAAIIPLHDVVESWCSNGPSWKRLHRDFGDGMVMDCRFRKMADAVEIDWLGSFQPEPARWAPEWRVERRSARRYDYDFSADRTEVTVDDV